MSDDIAVGLPTPNLADYESTRRTFDWDHARAGLGGLPELG